MSPVKKVEDVEALVDGHSPLEQQVPVGRSLSDRMKQRSAYLETHQTEKFPLPGFEDVLEVELRLLSFSTIQKIVERNDKIRDAATSGLYSLADQIVMATVGFYEVNGQERSELTDDWVALASRLENAPEGMTPRQAVFLLVGDKALHFLVSDWVEWAKSGRREVDDEVMRDFDMTG